MWRWPMLAVGLLVLGCGPSLRRVQESHVYFERCYAADFDPRIASPEKHACWTAWLEHYTIGQSEDRADYARQRVYAIEHGESVPRLPGLPEVAVGPRTVTPVTMSSTSEAAEEPDTAEARPERSERAAPERADRADDRPERPRRHRTPRLPRNANAACAVSACEPAWQRCVESCPDRSEGCETACNVELNSCARGCF